MKINKFILLIAAMVVTSQIAVANPQPSAAWKAEYEKNLSLVQKRTSGLRKDAAQNLAVPLGYAASHANEWGARPEYAKLVEMALPKLEAAGDLQLGRPAVQVLYETPTVPPASRLQAARYLGLGLVDEKGDYAGAEKLILPIQNLCETNGNLNVLADAVALRSHLWVLRDDRKAALKVIEDARGLRVGKANVKRLNQLLDAKYADVLKAFYDNRGLLDWYLSRGNKHAAFGLLLSGHVSDPALLLKLATDLAAQDGGHLEALCFLWTKDEAAACRLMPNFLNQRDWTTNYFLGKLADMIRGNAYPPILSPTAFRKWDVTKRTWDLYLDLQVKIGREPLPDIAWVSVFACAKLGDRKAAAAAADAGLANKKLSPEERYGFGMIKRILSLKGTEAEVMAALAKADAELGRDCPSDRRADRFARAAAIALALGDEGVQSGVAAYYKAHYHALPPKKTYDVGFSRTAVTGPENFPTALAPASAFTRTFGGSTDIFETDVTTGARNAGAAGGEGTVTLRIVADAWGLHILQTLVTEKARAIEAGDIGAGNYECYLATPGAPHRIFMCNADKTHPADPIALNYDMPGFRQGDERNPNDFRSSVRFSDKAIENYVAYSWGLYADVLPTDGAIWDFESIYWGAKSCAWNGTESIHGRSTFGQLRFRLDAAARRAIARERLFAAVRTYRAEKSPDPRMGSPFRAGVIDFWQDAATGDPAFYAKCVKPIVETLDPVAARVKSTMTDADVDELAAYLPRFHNLRFEIAGLREQYLTDELLP